ncbi:hypothetical protein BC832DRAFT_591506 [Gaertneriomyces semiglobifer]|nr:hypothetical protein BC832DRAFT_591506 [Gaertneriomyces semiglobifer]
MPRRSSGRSSSSARSHPSSAPNRPHSTSSSGGSVPARTAAPQPPAHVPVQQQRQPGLFGQMASTAAGVAVGSTIGHTLGAGMSGLFGGGSHHATQATDSPPQQYQQQQPYSTERVVDPLPCEKDQKSFLKCLDDSSNDISQCQFYLDMLKQCQSAQKTLM